MDKPPYMTCLYDDKGYQPYRVGSVLTVWHNWTTRKKNKQGLWDVSHHEECFEFAQWNPELGAKGYDVQAAMAQAIADLPKCAMEPGERPIGAAS